MAELVDRDYLGGGLHCVLGLCCCVVGDSGGLGPVGPKGQVDVSTQKTTLDKKSKSCSIRCIGDGEPLFVTWMDTSEVSVWTTVHLAVASDWRRAQAEGPVPQLSPELSLFQHLLLPLTTSFSTNKTFLGSSRLVQKHVTFKADSLNEIKLSPPFKQMFISKASLDMSCYQRAMREKTG